MSCTLSISGEATTYGKHCFKIKSDQGLPIGDALTANDLSKALGYSIVASSDEEDALFVECPQGDKDILTCCLEAISGVTIY